MKDKKSFILYHNLCEVFDDLTNEEAGILIKEIVSYSKARCDRMPFASKLSGVLKAVFNPFKSSIDTNFQKWEERCKKNKKNAEQRWKNATAYDRMRMNADKDKDKDKDKDIIKEKNIKKEKFDFACPEGIDNQLWKDYMQVRKSKKATNSETAYKGVIRELKKINSYSINPNDAIQIAVERNWIMPKAEWILNTTNQNNNGYKTNNDKDDSYAARARGLTQAIASKEGEYYSNNF